MERARSFYTDTLGLKLEWETERGFAVTSTDGSMVVVYRFGRTSATHTVVRFAIGGIDAVVAGLKAKGVVFEEYGMPGFTTVDGIATAPSGAKAAWFKDSEGNLLSIVQSETAA